MGDGAVGWERRSLGREGGDHPQHLPEPFTHSQVGHAALTRFREGLSVSPRLPRPALAPSPSPLSTVMPPLPLPLCFSLHSTSPALWCSPPRLEVGKKTSPLNKFTKLSLNFKPRCQAGSLAYLKLSYNCNFSARVGHQLKRYIHTL